MSLILKHFFKNKYSPSTFIRLIKFKFPRKNLTNCFLNEKNCTKIFLLYNIFSNNGSLTIFKRRKMYFFIIKLINSTLHILFYIAIWNELRRINIRNILNSNVVIIVIIIKDSNKLKFNFSLLFLCK